MDAIRVSSRQGKGSGLDVSHARDRPRKTRQRTFTRAYPQHLQHSLRERPACGMTRARGRQWGANRGQAKPTEKRRVSSMGIGGCRFRRGLDPAPNRERGEGVDPEIAPRTTGRVKCRSRRPAEVHASRLSFATPGALIFWQAGNLWNGNACLCCRRTCADFQSFPAPWRGDQAGTAGAAGGRRFGRMVADCTRGGRNRFATP